MKRIERIGPSTQSRGTKHGRRRRLALIAAAAIAIILVVFAIQLFLARRDLAAGASDLSAAVALTRGGNLASKPARLQITADISAANGGFSGAEQNLWLWTPVIDHLGWVPGYGSQLSPAYSIAATGEQTTAGALSLLHGLSPVWPVLSSKRTGSPVISRIAPTLAAGEQDFEGAAKDFTNAQNSLSGVPNSLGSSFTNRDLGRLRRAVPTLLTASKWLVAAPELLGDQQPSETLLGWQNADQIRATGGFLAAVDYITMRRGRTTIRGFGSSFPGAPQIPLPTPEAVYTDEGSLLFQDSNWSPDFPLSARYERWMFGQATGLQAQHPSST